MIERFRTYPIEGDVYQFENFRVLDNNDDFRVTDHKWKLELHPVTSIKPSTALIDADGFNFVSVGDISNRVTLQSGLIGICILLATIQGLHIVKS